MRFHFLMLIIVILVSLGMHGLASAASTARRPGQSRGLPAVVSGVPAY